MSATTLFRCTKCLKWSHARKQPRKHQRWVNRTEPEFEQELSEGAVYDYQGGMLKDEGHFVDCGPFTSYIAITEADFAMLLKSNKRIGDSACQ